MFLHSMISRNFSCCLDFLTQFFDCLLTQDWNEMKLNYIWNWRFFASDFTDWGKMDLKVSRKNDEKVKYRSLLFSQYSVTSRLRVARLPTLALGSLLVCLFCLFSSGCLQPAWPGPVKKRWARFFSSLGTRVYEKNEEIFIVIVKPKKLEVSQLFFLW